MQIVSLGLLGHLEGPLVQDWADGDFTGPGNSPILTVPLDGHTSLKALQVKTRSPFLTSISLCPSFSIPSSLLALRV